MKKVIMLMIVAMMVVPVFVAKASTPDLQIGQVFYTNKSPFTLEGKAEPGSQVSIEGQNLFTNVGNDGLFRIYLDVIEGGNFYQVITQKNDAKTTKDIYVEMDSTPPEVTLIADGKTYTDQKVSMAVKDADTESILCFTDPGCTVKIDDVTQKTNGNRIDLSFKLKKAPSVNNFGVHVFDKYGNKSDVILVINNIHTKILKIGVENNNMSIDEEHISINKLKIKNGVYMINIRLLCESLPANLSWDVGSRTSIVESGNDILKCRANVDQVNFNGKEVKVDASPFIENGNTQLPLKSCFELFGYTYKFDKSVNEITLTKTIYP